MNPIYHSNQESKYDFSRPPRFYLSLVNQTCRKFHRTQVQASLQIQASLQS
uniref:Uncharacterized protein n=1 Tax=Medicago truncatula TaxID=3880 RepID=I3SZI1_MEDTR|nr:unknown [Medicago truncatula]